MVSKPNRLREHAVDSSFVGVTRIIMITPYYTHSFGDFGVASLSKNDGVRVGL